MTDSIILTDVQKQLIEKIGVMHEQSGLQPAASRILSLLIVAPSTELSFDQIREILTLSKSATSNALNMLLNTNRIEYMTKPGDRKRYFRSKIMSWKKEMKDSVKRFKGVADLFEEVLKQRPDNTKAFNSELSEIIDFMRFIADESPALYAKWEAKNS